MQTKTKVNWVLATTLCLAVSLPGFAANSSQNLEQVLRPCIDDQTFAVVRLDVTKLDLDAFVNQALSLVNEHVGPNAAKQVKADLKNFQTEAGAQLNGLRKAGGKDIFVVFSMYDFPHFFVAVPIPSGGNSSRLRQQVQKMTEDFNVGDIEIHVTDRLILAGLKQTITRLKTASPGRSQALAAEPVCTELRNP